MDIKKIKAIVDMVKESGIAELEIAEGEDKLKITASYNNASVSTPHTTSHVPPTGTQHNQHAPLAVTNSTGTTNIEVPAPMEILSGKQITSPMVGTFYRSSSPTTPPFVEIGQEIKAGQVLCIIEAMKLMNQIESDQAGIIKKILVDDGAPVEFGQPLFVVE